MISTRGRYALRVMIDLAEHGNGRYIPLREIAERQEISLKYIEKILPLLARGALIEGIHGKGGGYRLCREPEEYTVGEILRLTEGELAPVACLSEGAPPCPHASYCRTLPMWRDYCRMTNEFFDGITVADLIKVPKNCDYII
ncbi:MAG: RrF2 family transcriptional regulator [Eubacteriales bacterium]